MDEKTMNKFQILSRLRRAEGQLRGIQKMVENDRYWIEIEQQLASVQSATKNVAIILLENQASSCIKNAIKNGNESEEIKKMNLVLKQFVKI